jgi:uncharacterized protein YndB with AHSA1/START domain
MMPTDNVTLMMTKVFPASAEFLFDAWTKPEMMKRWYHAAEKWTTPLAETDLREGGTYFVQMKTMDGRLLDLNGIYKTIERPTKLVFTFHARVGAVNTGELYETLVTLRFKKIDDNTTEMTLTEEGFRTEKDMSGNNHGWNECLNCLRLYAEEEK